MRFSAAGGVPSVRRNARRMRSESAKPQIRAMSLTEPAPLSSAARAASTRSRQNVSARANTRNAATRYCARSYVFLEFRYLHGRAAAVISAIEPTPYRAEFLSIANNFAIVEVMRKREYLGQLELMVLFAVMRPAGDAYGVLISREIAEKSGREVALASVYAALERLERKGFVTPSLGEPTAERGGKARMYFRPTAAGVREAREARETLLRLSSDLAALADGTR